MKDGFGVEPGVWFRLALGGITGHRDFARDTGVIVKPADATKVADAIVRVFIEHGDRTNRNKARMKYVLDAMGFEKYLALVEEKLGRKLVRVPAEAVAPRPRVRSRRPYRRASRRSRRACTGSASCCRSASSRRRRCAGSPRSRSRCGDGDIRLTVWQNLLISGVPTDKLEARGSRDRGARAHHQGELDPRRPRRLHRQHRLPVLGLRHQAPRRGDRALVRGARRARRAGEHPPHRLPSFLRAALHRRHRPPRLQGADLARTATPSRAITSWSAAASVRTRRSAANSIAT